MTITTEELFKLLDEATPGPWLYGEDTEGSGKLSIHTNDGYYVALIDHGGAENANAALIALTTTIAAELITARAKLKAAEKLAAAAHQAKAYIEADECAHGRKFGDGNAIRSAISAWEAAR